MKIAYLDGMRFKVALIAGGHNLIANQNNLNKINVFPVPDGDTGTNMAATIHAILSGLRGEAEPAFHTVSRTVAANALEHAHGNSGVILAQFFVGIAEGAREKMKVSAADFSLALKQARHYAYEAMLDPREGTILSVIRVMEETWQSLSARVHDFGTILERSLERCREELAHSPEKLKVLKQANVVDAGALGFINFLEGVAHFIHSGKLESVEESLTHIQNLEAATIANDAADQITYRYCTECLVDGTEISRETLVPELSALGDSIILAGTRDTLKLHIHTDEPERVWNLMATYGSVRGKKADDMKAQVEDRQSHRKPIALVVDSLADLPQDLIEAHDIHVVPIRVQFGTKQYTDRVNLDTRTFYRLLKEEKDFPRTSQPTPADFINLYKHLLDHHDQVISLHIAEKLSGTYGSAVNAARQIDPDRIHVVDSRSGGLALGIIALRAAELIEEETDLVDVLKEIEKLSRNRKIYILFNTLDNIIRGGRLNKRIGRLLTRLNLMPVITYTPEGSLGRAGFMKKDGTRPARIIKRLQRELKDQQPTEIGIMHGNDPQAAARFQLQVEEAFPHSRIIVSEIGPGIGSYAGEGTLAIVTFTQ